MDRNSATTLAILLGASEFPESPNLTCPPSFEHSARAVKQYLLDWEQGLGIPHENLLDLFDASIPPNVLTHSIETFIVERIRIAEDGGPRPTDVLVYYVGHGGFTEEDHAYFLATRSTRKGDEGTSSLRITSLKTALKPSNFLRRYIILDCCFAASAYSTFQATGPLQVAVEKTAATMGRGTALLCASGARDAAMAPRDAEYTMFSGALIDTLTHGLDIPDLRLSLAELAKGVAAFIDAKYPDGNVRPQVHCPDPVEGDVSTFGIFPNPASTSHYNNNIGGSARVEGGTIVERTVKPPPIVKLKWWEPPSLAPRRIGRGLLVLFGAHILIGLTFTASSLFGLSQKGEPDLLFAVALCVAMFFAWSHAGYLIASGLYWTLRGQPAPRVRPPGRPVIQLAVWSLVPFALSLVVVLGNDMKILDWSNATVEPLSHPLFLSFCVLDTYCLYEVSRALFWTARVIFRLDE